MFRFHHDRLQLKERLGKGRFGAVFPYQKDPKDPRDRKWVVKRVRADDSDVLVASLPEVVLGFSCDHPRIVPVKGYFIEKDSDNIGYNIYMKLSRMKGTLGDDFKERKRSGNPYLEQDLIRHFHSLVCGIEYLHSKKIYHGDIKPDNLLLNDTGVLKVGDIGIAKHVEDEDSYQNLTGQIGTYQYSAPEVLGEKATKETLPKADVWSIGVIILELSVFDFKLLNCSLPPEKLQNKLDELFKNLQGKYHISLVNLIQRVLSLNPKQRPEIGEVKAELEKNFCDILDKDLLSLEKLTSLIQKEETQPEIELLNQHIKEILKKSDAERKQLKETISQLELQLTQQKQKYEDQIVVLQIQNNDNSLLSQKEDYDQLQAERKATSKELADCNEKLKNYEKRIKNLQQEKTSFEKKSKDLEKYIETNVKKQMKSYEDQIKALQETQFKEKTVLDQEREKLLKEINTLKPKVKELASLKELRESFGIEYEKNLDKAILQLKEKFNQWFTFRSNSRRLAIAYANTSITNEHLGKLPEDLIRILGENNLFNLFGLEFEFNQCENLTDKAIEHCAKIISNPSLNLQSFIFSMRIQRTTDAGVEKLAAAIETSCKSIWELKLTISFGYSGLINYVTTSKIQSLKERFAHIPKLAIS